MSSETIAILVGLVLIAIIYGYYYERREKKTIAKSLSDSKQRLAEQEDKEEKRLQSKAVHLLEEQIRILNQIERNTR